MDDFCIRRPVEIRREYLRLVPLQK